MVRDSDGDETNFLHKLSLTETLVSRIRISIANG